MTLDLKIAGGTSDLGFQVWTAVRLRIPGRTNSRSKIHNFQKTRLVSRTEILDPDPRFLPWIQDTFFDNLGSWILDPYNVRLEIFKSELFSDDSQVTET